MLNFATQDHLIWKKVLYNSICNCYQFWELIQVGCCHRFSNRLQAMLSEKHKMELTQKNINSLKYDHKLVTSDAKSPSSPGVSRFGTSPPGIPRVNKRNLPVFFADWLPKRIFRKSRKYIKTYTCCSIKSSKFNSCEKYNVRLWEQKRVSIAVAYSTLLFIVIGLCLEFVLKNYPKGAIRREEPPVISKFQAFLTWHYWTAIFLP